VDGCGWLGLVLGARRTASGVPYHLNDGAVEVRLPWGSGGGSDGAVVFVGRE